jgi:3-dehydroshikimate dehydratase
VKVNLCSITFRHQLVSFIDLIHFAAKSGFSGIELWGVHANALLSAPPDSLSSVLVELGRLPVEISMISDYVPLDAGVDFATTLQQWQHLIGIAHRFETTNIRIFACGQGSNHAKPDEWKVCMKRLRHLADIAEERGVTLVIETHPNTYADTLKSTLQILDDTHHDSIRINLDFLHLWETGSQPREALRALRPYVVNCHLKNVKSWEHLEEFAPDNVYSPSGRREGMISLSEGIVNYSDALYDLFQFGEGIPLAIEWFGDRPFQYLMLEREWLIQMEQQFRTSKIGG